MRKSSLVASLLVAILAAGTTLGEEQGRSAARTVPQVQAAPGWIERGFARLERTIERLEAKLSGRGRDGMMEGCQDMMGGGMMGGSRPNERWRGSGEKP